MTLDRDFDRIASAWLADGPTELSDRVLDVVVDQVHLTRQRRVVRAPWRFRTMSMPARVAALVAVGVLAIAGAVALGGIGGLSRTNTTPAPTTPASTSPAASGAIADQIGSLDTTFTSDWHGYSMQHPAGWVVTPSHVAWQRGDASASSADQLVGRNARFLGSQMPYAKDETSAQWLAAFCQWESLSSCPATWERVGVSGANGYLFADTLPSGGSITGNRYRAVVTLPQRAYAFTFEGAVDRATVNDVLARVFFFPSNTVEMAPLSGTFSSPTYGYTVGTLPTWKITNAQQPLAGVDNESPTMDNIDITGTDTTFSGASEQLGSQAYAAFLAAFHANTAKGVPQGCDGGDPSTWPTIQVGDQTGSLEMLCNAAEALVHVGDRVYIFDWGNSTFETSTHFNLASWEQLLRTIRFQPWTANLSKTFTSPTYGYSILTEPNWTTTPSTKAWHDTSNPSDSMDSIDITGANLGIGAQSQKLGGRTFDQFVQQFYEGQLAALGPSCVGGAPSTWEDVQIGDKTGKLEIQCGTDEALVQAGDRVYLFEIGNSADAPLWSLDAWKTVLRGVTLDPASANT